MKWPYKASNHLQWFTNIEIHPITVSGSGKAQRTIQNLEILQHDSLIDISERGLHFLTLSSVQGWKADSGPNGRLNVDYSTAILWSLMMSMMAEYCHSDVHRQRRCRRQVDSHKYLYGQLKHNGGIGTGGFCNSNHSSRYIYPVVAKLYATVPEFRFHAPQKNPYHTILIGYQPCRFSTSLSLGAETAVSRLRLQCARPPPHIVKLLSRTHAPNNLELSVEFTHLHCRAPQKLITSASVILFQSVHLTFSVFCFSDVSMQNNMCCSFSFLNIHQFILYKMYIHARLQVQGDNTQI